ncbi:MAG TPA: hypothetical protein VMG10_21050 [Gemmataceae bacterium]|nr:hypothetical protein [Gemmataceae bacterium]
MGSDAGLIHFKGCKNLIHLYLYWTNVSTGLTHSKPRSLMIAARRRIPRRKR